MVFKCALRDKHMFTAVSLISDSHSMEHGGIGISLTFGNTFCC